MNDLEERVKALEEKVKMLEETLETVKNMNLSEQMERYIQKRSQTLKMVDLVNSVSSKPTLDFRKEEEKVKTIKNIKDDLDKQIAKAVANNNDFSDKSPDDPQFFNFEEESDLRRLVGSGLRITGYNGFDTERVVIPKEIDGKIVVTIGEKAFMNASFSEITLPESIKAVMKNAFYGCEKLMNISLPDNLIALGEGSFSKSGLNKINIPEKIKKIPDYCFAECVNLQNIHLGKNTSEIGFHSFSGCRKLSNIILPNKIKTIGSHCFHETAITSIIIPAGVKTISSNSFTNNMNTIVFLGKVTEITQPSFSITQLSFSWGGINKSAVIYCLPGSNVQKFARENNISMKPLSEFKIEDLDS